MKHPVSLDIKKEDFRFGENQSGKLLFIKSNR